MWVVSLSEYEASLSVTRSARSIGAWKGVGERSEATDRRAFPNAEARNYLRANPRLIDLFPNQTQFTNLELWVDADHAGCIRSRKSTTGTALQLGKCTIRTTCKSQAVIALSSGEAECYSLVSGLCQALREQSTLQD